jgi:hypothetical protein
MGDTERRIAEIERMLEERTARASAISTRSSTSSRSG